jgi:DNA modification methylase
VVSGGELSQFQMINDDCLKVLPTLKDKSIDLVLTDPPYGTTSCKWDSVIPFDLMWLNLKRIIKDSGCIALFGTEPFSSYLRISNIKNYKYDWLWNKKVGTNFMSAKNQPLKFHENILIFNSKTYYPIKEKRDKPKDYRNTKNKYKKTNIFNTKLLEAKILRVDKYPNSIISINSQEKECNNINRVHPTQKPVALLEYIIKTYTNENDIVLDFTMGSGSTGVACKNLNRDFIGIELDKDYYKIAKQRVGVLN